MGIIDDDFYDDGRVSFDELIAKGEYESKKDNILKGFKLFQKKYVYKGVAFQIILVLLGIASQVMNIVAAAENEDVSFSYMLIVLCFVLGIYLLIRPKNIFRRLAESLDELDGVKYSAEIYTNKIIITTLYDPYKDESAEEEAQEQTEDDENEDEEDNGPPATIIHIDNGTVEIVESSDLFVVYIKKVNVFVIPKAAFKVYELTEIKNRLSNIMGVRYKVD